MSDLIIPDVFAAFLRSARDDGILEDVDPGRFVRNPRGAVIMPCSDGDEFDDLYEFHLRIQRGATCKHQIGANGGVLILPEGSPLLHPRFWPLVPEYYAELIAESMQLKRTDTLAAYTHFPCGKATEAELSPVDQLLLLCGAKQWLKPRLPKGSKVVAMVQIRWPDKPAPRNRNTYKLSTKACLDWLRRHPEHLDRVGRRVGRELLQET